jgi:hypothetical protein
MTAREGENGLSIQAARALAKAGAGHSMDAASMAETE